MTDTTRELIQIGELAERSGLSLRTIRHYDDEGLLTPTTRSAGGFRLYSSKDLDRLLVIRRMKPLGFSIEEMRDLLDVVNRLQQTPTASDHADLRRRLDDMRASARERRDTLRTRLAWADEFVDLLDRL